MLPLNCSCAVSASVATNAIAMLKKNFFITIYNMVEVSEVMP